MPLSATSICTAGTDDRVALRIAGNHQDVEDMLHEASMRLSVFKHVCRRIPFIGRFPCDPI
jgi:hypothetical protein